MAVTNVVTNRDARVAQPVGEQTLWYKDAIIYELHVRAFCDSDGDGIGDFRGPDRRSSTTCRTSASPPSGCCRSTRRRCKDDGYDIADYTDVHPAYGTLRDFTRVPARGAPTAGCGSSPSWCSTTPRTSTPGSSARAARQPGSALARLLRLERHAGASTRTRGSSSRTSSPRTGPGTRWPRPTTGTASTRTSPT